MGLLLHSGEHCPEFNPEAVRGQEQPSSEADSRVMGRLDLMQNRR